MVRDVVPKKGATLGLVFPVGMTRLPESKEIFDEMADFVLTTLLER